MFCEQTLAQLRTSCGDSHGLGNDLGSHADGATNVSVADTPKELPTEHVVCDVSILLFLTFVLHQFLLVCLLLSFLSPLLLSIYLVAPEEENFLSKVLVSLLPCVLSYG